MCCAGGGRKLASRAALLLLVYIHSTNLFFPSLYLSERTPSAMSGQQALQTLKALSPVQQRKAAAILGALLADVASEYATSKMESHFFRCRAQCFVCLLARSLCVAALCRAWTMACNMHDVGVVSSISRFYSKGGKYFVSKFVGGSGHGRGEQLLVEKSGILMPRSCNSTHAHIPLGHSSKLP